MGKEVEPHTRCVRTSFPKGYVVVDPKPILNCYECSQDQQMPIKAWRHEQVQGHPNGELTFNAIQSR